MLLPELKSLNKKLLLKWFKQFNQTISYLNKQSELLYITDYTSISTLTQCMYAMHLLWVLKLHFFSLDQNMRAALNIRSNWATLNLIF